MTPNLRIPQKVEVTTCANQSRRLVTAKRIQRALKRIRLITLNASWPREEARGLAEATRSRREHHLVSAPALWPLVPWRLRLTFLTKLQRNFKSRFMSPCITAFLGNPSLASMSIIPTFVGPDARILYSHDGVMDGRVPGLASSGQIHQTGGSDG